MRVLVAVASKHGSTREIAEGIAEELRANDLSADLKVVGEVGAVTGYDAVILGSAIYAGNWLPQAKSFAERNQAELAKLPVWVFSSGPLGAENPQPQDNPEQLTAPLGATPIRAHQIFVGKLDSASLSFAERLLVKAVRAPYGDFRNWDEIRGWARAIAAELHAERIS